MPSALDPAKRAAILADIRKAKKHGKLSRNHIARTHQVSGSTVSNIAAQEGLADAFDRSATVKTTRAKQFDAKAARAELVVDLLKDAQRFRARAWDRYTQVVSGPTGPDLVETTLPPLRDQQAAYTTVAICIDKAQKLTDAETGDGTAHARSLLGRLGEAFQLAADTYGDETTTTDPDPKPGNST